MNVNVQDLRKLYGNQAVLDGVQFAVRPGECFGIIGPNGSGKSTLLKMLSGVERADSGHVHLNGVDIAKMKIKQIARKIAVLLQEALSPVDYSVRDVIEMGRYPHQNWWGIDDTECTSLIADISYKLCLEHLLHRAVSTLSGGERQRVAIAKAMAQQPDLLLLDEPTTFLDIGYQMQMMDMVRNWQVEQGITVITVLHDLNLAAQYCDRILILNQGKQIALGTPAEVISDHLIESVYGTRPIILEHPVSAIPQILLQPGLLPLQ